MWKERMQAEVEEKDDGTNREVAALREQVEALQDDLAAERERAEERSRLAQQAQADMEDAANEASSAMQVRMLPLFCFLFCFLFACPVGRRTFGGPHGSVCCGGQQAALDENNRLKEQVKELEAGAEAAAGNDAEVGTLKAQVQQLETKVRVLSFLCCTHLNQKHLTFTRVGVTTAEGGAYSCFKAKASGGTVGICCCCESCERGRCCSCCPPWRWGRWCQQRTTWIRGAQAETSFGQGAAGSFGCW